MQLESAIANYELAYRMQTAVPELMDLADETPATRRALRTGRDVPADAIFAPAVPARAATGRARRALHRTDLPRRSAATAGISTADLKEGHENNARAVDQPIARLAERSESSAACWTRRWSFGPASSAARPSPREATAAITIRSASRIWLAGGGMKGGTIYGATDEYGYKAVENKVEIHDLHATMLHLLGIDHKRLTFRFGGRDMRLTDVHGEVINEILA